MRRGRPLPSALALALGLGAGLLMVSPVPPSIAAPPAGAGAKGLKARCEIHLIHGLNRPGKFPASLAHLRTRLQAQPFKVFLSFALLGTYNMPLTTGRLSRKKLAGPYRLEGQLISQVTTSKGKSRLRFELALYRRQTRKRKAKRMLKSTLVLDRGGTLFLAGPPYKGGKLVIGLTCR